MQQLLAGEVEACRSHHARAHVPEGRHLRGAGGESKDVAEQLQELERLGGSGARRCGKVTCNRSKHKAHIVHGEPVLSKVADDAEQHFTLFGRLCSFAEVRQEPEKHVDRVVSSHAELPIVWT